MAALLCFLRRQSPGTEMFADCARALPAAAETAAGKRVKPTPTRGTPSATAHAAERAAPTRNAKERRRARSVPARDALGGWRAGGPMC